MRFILILLPFLFMNICWGKTTDPITLCDEFKNGNYPDCKVSGKGLGCMARFLSDKKLINSSNLGSTAINASSELVKEGFKKNTELVDSADKIPDGSIVILGGKSENCEFSKFGNIGIKCEGGTVISNSRGKMEITPIYKLKGCIKDVLASPNVANDNDSNVEIDPHNFCENFKREQCQNGLGLGCVSKYLRKKNITNEKVMATSAKESIPAFEKLGFEDLLVKNKELLSDIANIPEGSIVVFAKDDAGDCPVSRQTGNVGITCNNSSIIWPSHNGIKTQSLENIAKKFPSCIKAVFQHPRLKAKSTTPHNSSGSSKSSGGAK